MLKQKKNILWLVELNGFVIVVLIYRTRQNKNDSIQSKIIPIFSDNICYLDSDAYRKETAKIKQFVTK